MQNIKEGTLLWEPSPERKNDTNLNKYMAYLERTYGHKFNDYSSLWAWSVEQPEQFWESIWTYFNVYSPTPYEEVLTSYKMPGAKWFPGAKVNYTEHIFKDRDFSKTAIIHKSETRETAEISWGELYEKTIALQQTLKQFGVKQGDRVVAYVANSYEAIVAFLATASLGAIWSSASPDFGVQTVIDRFTQIEPKVLIAVDGYSYKGKPFNRVDVVEEIQTKLPSLEQTIIIPFLNKSPDIQNLDNACLWDQCMKNKVAHELTYEYIPFNDPLWILFSSGTTGAPKPIVQSQGGILLEHLKATAFHVDLDENDRFFWYTTTGWMMWNFLVGGLLVGSTVVLYDGSPAYPSLDLLWEFAEETKITVFGTSAGFISANMQHNISPKEKYDLSHLKSISSTGAPLPPEGFKWCYDHVKEDLWIASVSGGTDVCTAFILGAPILPVYAGELQCRGLGAKIESYTDEGNAVINDIGELVLTLPMPSMPIYFWNDTDGSRLHESYFDMFEGVWRHGDYLKITDRETCIIYGRSDATINRGGVRIGTSEIYRAVDHVKDIVDSLIVDIPVQNNNSVVLLFVVLKEGKQLTEAMKTEIRHLIQTNCSPRHAPNKIYAVDELPTTLNGKKLEIPVKRILMGENVDEVVNKDSLKNPNALNYFIQFAKDGMSK